jgi:hypothetical protein
MALPLCSSHTRRLLFTHILSIIVFLLHPAYFSKALSDLSRPFFQLKIAKSATPLNLTPFTILFNSTRLLLYYQVFSFISKTVLRRQDAPHEIGLFNKRSQASIKWDNNTIYKGFFYP